MMANKATNCEKHSRQIIIDSGASSITLNKAWVHAIQELTAAHESILTASGIIDDYTGPY